MANYRLNVRAQTQSDSENCERAHVHSETKKINQNNSLIKTWFAILPTPVHRIVRICAPLKMCIDYDKLRNFVQQIAKYISFVGQLLLSQRADTVKY